MGAQPTMLRPHMAVLASEYQYTEGARRVDATIPATPAASGARPFVLAAGPWLGFGLG